VGVGHTGSWAPCVVNLGCGRWRGAGSVIAGHGDIDGDIALIPFDCHAKV
jgi:hypothetical protein